MIDENAINERASSPLRAPKDRHGNRRCYGFGSSELLPLDEGLDTWEEAAETIAEFFGWRVTGYGPGISFDARDPTTIKSVTRYYSRWTLPEIVCIRMLNRIEEVGG